MWMEFKLEIININDRFSGLILLLYLTAAKLVIYFQRKLFFICYTSGDKYIHEL